METETREEGLTGLIMVDINDIVYTFDFEFTIFQACLQKSVIIPRFCYHNKLSIAGNCRICGVEEKNSSKIIISCATLIDKGSQVHTETQLTLQARENVIEFLLINHPLDCPVCDQAGECDLQDQTFLFGADKGRFYENYKRAVENKNFSPLIKFSLNRCIHCARCTRFLSEVSESNLFSLLGRGAATEISFYTSKIRAIDEMSGNIIDLCPVGASTSKPYAFSARWWEHIDMHYFDIFDDFLSNIRVDLRGTSFLRVIPSFNHRVNDEWISDKVRFNYDAYFKQRLLEPFFIDNERFCLYCTWKNCATFYKKYLVSLLNFLFLKKKKNYLHVYGYDRFNDSFTSLMLKKYKNLFKWNFFYSNSYSFNKKLDDRNLFISNYSIEALESSEELLNIIFLNVNLRYENPVLNLRFKELYRENDNISFFGLGCQNTAISKYTFLGCNFFIASGRFLLNNFFHLQKSIFFLGSFYFFNNLFFQYIEKIRCFFIKIFDLSIFFNFSTIFGNRVVNFEINTVSNKNFFNSIFTPMFWPNIFYNNDLNFLSTNFFKNTNSLVIFQGHHIDEFANHTTAVFPSRIFLERPDFFINSEGYIGFRTFSYLELFTELARDSWGIMMLILKTCTNVTVATGLDYLLLYAKKITPIFIAAKDGKNYFTFIEKKSKTINNLFILKNVLFYSLINDFYLSDSISKFSPVMSLCSKKLTLINDFKLLFNDFTELND